MKFKKQIILSRRFILIFSIILGSTFTQAEESTPQIYGIQGSEVKSITPSSEGKSALMTLSEKQEKQTVILPLNEDEKSPQKKSYQVKRGETLWRISKNTGVSVLEIKRLNRLKSDLIRVGEILILEGNPLEIRRAIPLVKEVEHHELKVRDLNPPSIEKVEGDRVESTPEKSAPAVDPLSDRFLIEIRKMVGDQVGYNQTWRPPGSDRNWVMDCSNTTRYLFYKIFKLDIGRTASEQYFRLKGKGMAWEVPRDERERPDIGYLQAHLKVGDLLFWEHTYQPEREPPVTHVMVYLGIDKQGRFLMIGSEQGKGLLDSSFNGPDLYYFNPLAEKGGHYQFLFFGWKPGRFIAFGRPLPES